MIDPSFMNRAIRLFLVCKKSRDRPLDIVAAKTAARGRSFYHFTIGGHQSGDANMEATAAYAMYPPSVPLNEVLHTLGQGGFGKENICMMLSPTHPIATCVREANAQTFERQQTAAAAGIIGWLSEFGAVLIPTFGFFIRSKVFFQALIVKQDTMARLGHCAPLAALGFSDDDAERFESRVRDVGVFVYVACPGTDQTRWALELLRATGAEEAGALQSEAPVETTA